MTLPSPRAWRLSRSGYSLSPPMRSILTAEGAETRRGTLVSSVFLCALCGLLASCAHLQGIARPQGQVALRTTIDSLVDASEFSDAHWGVLIVDPATGDTLYARNAGQLF